MKTYFKLFSLLVFVLVLVSGCKKDDDPGETEAERQQRLVSKTWATGSVSYTEESTPLAGFDDFSITFNSTGTFSTSGGQAGVSYLPSSGSWSIDSNDLTALTLTDNGNTVEVDIVTLSETAFVFNVAGPGVKATDPDRTVRYDLVSQ
ncbi:lipocalin family protein [Roseivirga sp. BDSF3-8]|uniref:lipocalin family protein n=1 Tax=Roseivirga sp. BDSF3-8 TaxID=3241598 RepID=UPI003531D6E5